MRATRHPDRSRRQRPQGGSVGGQRGLRNTWGEITENFLRARRIADLLLGVYAAPAYLRREGSPTHPGELAGEDHRIVGYRTRTGALLPTTMRRGDELLQLTGRHVLSADDGNAFLTAGVAGFGVLCVPHFMAHAPLLRGELVPLFEDWHVDPMPLSLAYPPNRHVSRKLRVFIDWVAELLAGKALGIDPPDLSSGSVPRGQNGNIASGTP